jgi:hypothetical protein
METSNGKIKNQKKNINFTPTTDLENPIKNNNNNNKMKESAKSIKINLRTNRKDHELNISKIIIIIIF